MMKLTNRFHVAMRLLSNITDDVEVWWKQKSVTFLDSYVYTLTTSCHFSVVFQL